MNTQLKILSMLLPKLKLPTELFDQGYRFVSLDAIYLFTNSHYKKQSTLHLKTFILKIIKHYYQETCYEKTYERHL